MNCKKITASVLLAAFAAFSPAGSFAGSSGVANAAQLSEREATCFQYENGGFRLLIPKAYDDLLETEIVKDRKNGLLYRVSEKASVEAAKKLAYDSRGAGWLFSIGKIDEGRRRELLCGDMSGAEIFARDANGQCYVYYHPTDVRYMRENNEAMKRDQEQWTMLNEWAWSSVRTDFIRDNSLETAAYDNSEVSIAIARAAYKPNVRYTVSTTQYGPLTPESGSFDALPFVERLSSGLILDRAEGEAPDGEYVVLAFPDEDTRFDFFKAEGGENLVRMVWNGDNEALWQLSYTDPAVKASEIMQEWYDALAEAMDVHDLAGMTLGGWTLSEDGAVTEEALNAFNKASGALLGVNYTPVALLGTQLVSGTNYCLLCEAAVVYPGAQPYYALVYVYADLQGAAEISTIVPLDIAELSEAEAE